SIPENTMANFGPMYLTKIYSFDKLAFTTSQTFVIIVSPVFLLMSSFISSRLIILNMHIVDVVYWSITFLPSAYKYSAVFKVLYLSSLTMLSIILWFSTVLKTETIFVRITSSIVVSIWSNSCGWLPSKS